MVEEYVSAAIVLPFVDDLGWVVTRSDVNWDIIKHERCAMNSIVCASRQGLQFNIAKTKTALFTRRQGHK